MTAAVVMDIISRLPGCAGQAADAVSAYTQVKMEDAADAVSAYTQVNFEDAPRLLNQNVQTYGCVFHDINDQSLGQTNIEDPVVPLERNLYEHPLAGLLREREFGEVLLELGW